MTFYRWTTVIQLYETMNDTSYNDDCTVLIAVVNLNDNINTGTVTN